MKEDLIAIGNFVQTACLKVGRGETNEIYGGKIHCEAIQDKVDICVYEVSKFGTQSVLGTDPFIVENRYQNNILTDIKIAQHGVSSGRLSESFKQDYAFYVNIDVLNNTVDFSKYNADKFTEMIEKWDGLKTRIINGVQKILDEKILAQQKETQKIKENINKIKNIER
jgi:hypothetical protein